MEIRSRSLWCATTLLFAGLAAHAQVAIWTYHYNNQRTGANTNESVLTQANVNSNYFGKLFTYPADGYVYAEPLYIPGVNIQGRGLHNVFFVATEHNTLYAFDADNSGAAGGILWSTNFGPSAVTTIPGVYTNQNFGLRYNNGVYTDIEPEVGINSTPVIDTNSGTIYVDSFTGPVEGGVTNYYHTLHAINISNGTEQPYGPIVVAASVPGTGLDSVGGRVYFTAKQQCQRSGLTLAGGIVYLCFSGYADTDPYHGWVIGYNATNLVQLTNYVFNTTPNSTYANSGSNPGEGGIWMGGGGLAVDAQTNLYFITGNGVYNATNSSGVTEFADCFMKLSTTNGLAVKDYFAPWNQADLQFNDKDLGSGAVIVLPDQTGPNPHVIIGAGKDQGTGAVIYDLNRDQFTTDNKHYDATNSVDNILQTTPNTIYGSFDTPAYFNGQIYYACSGDFLYAFGIVNGTIAGIYSQDRSHSYGFPGATPCISANGVNNGIVWTVRMGSPQILFASDASYVANDLYSSADAGTRDQLRSGAKFAVPTVADGKVFVGGSNSVSVFGLLGGTFAFSAPSYNAQQANTNALITVNRLGGTNGAAQVSYSTVAGGSAVSGVNYTSVSGILNWTNGESNPKTFTVPVINDGLADTNLTIKLALSSPTNAASALAPQNTTVLNIVPSPTSVWKRAWFGANANNPIAGDNVSPANDGIPNLLAYAYALNPTIFNTNPFAGAAVGNQFQLKFPRNTSAWDITYAIQISSNMALWNNLLTYTAASGWITNVPGASVSESAPIGLPPAQYVNVLATATTNKAAAHIPEFLRLQIHR